VKKKKPIDIVGLDLAQADDRSVHIIAESVPAADERGFPAPELHVKHLHRFPVNVSYLDQASKVVEIRDGPIDRDPGETLKARAGNRVDS
jgi:hypothetical protein